jgi:hypothetical protein
LRDLMKSPVAGGVAHAAFAGKGRTGGTGEGAAPWHGARGAQRADQRVGGVAGVEEGNEAATLVTIGAGGGGRGAVAQWGGYFDPSLSTSGPSGGVLTPTSAYLASLPPGDVSDKLETSAAAQHLASYFNQGGVGGITALDLGFPTEPSLFPDFLFNPPVLSDEMDRKFYVPEQKFCLGYLYPWSVPPTQVLSGYAKKVRFTPFSLFPPFPSFYRPTNPFF